MTGTFLVAGGAGFVGSHFVHLLNRRGLRTVVLDALTYAGSESNLSGLMHSEANEFHQGSITDVESVRRLLARGDVGTVVNFAAESHVDRSIREPAPFVMTNVVGTSTLLYAALEYWREKAPKDFRYVQVSTDEVYGSLGPTGSFREDSPLAPNSPYSATKASADLLVRAFYKTYGMPLVTTRCGNNYGPRQHPEKFIPKLVRNALEGQPLPLYGDGRQVRDWIHVEDHCEGVYLASTRGEPGATYAFGGRHEMTNSDVAKDVTALLDELAPRADGRTHRSDVVNVEDRPGHDYRYAIDDRISRSSLGFETKRTWEEGLRETVSWYVRNRSPV